MTPAQLLEDRPTQLLEHRPEIRSGGIRSGSSMAGTVSERIIPGNWKPLSDCHAAEHLLVGTHDGSSSSTVPACFTCRFTEPVAG